MSACRERSVTVTVLTRKVRVFLKVGHCIVFFSVFGASYVRASLYLLPSLHQVDIFDVLLVSWD